METIISYAITPIETNIENRNIKLDNCFCLRIEDFMIIFV